MGHIRILASRSFGFWLAAHRLDLPGHIRSGETRRRSGKDQNHLGDPPYSELVDYTYSKSLAINSDIVESISNSYNPALDKGRSLNDIQHYAVVASTWEIPVGRGKSFLATGPLSKILGNWMTNSIITMRGGFPFSVYASGDVCNCAANSERAQQVGNPLSGFTRSRVQWFNTAAFVQPSQGTFGDSGHNILSGPGAASVDFSVFRTISVKEKAKLEIRSEFFNLFNRVNFGNPGSTVLTTTYGVITSAADPRIIQFALKFQF